MGKDEDCSSTKPEYLGKQEQDNYGQNMPPNILALISQYSERPDLLLETLEKHDPGFIQRMLKRTEEKTANYESKSFQFGERQAYTSLVIQSIAAFAILVIIGIAVWKEAGFWSLLALGIIYAITQSGAEGFIELAKSVRELVKGKNDS